MEHIMTLHNVSASYDGREVLSDLSLDIPARRITAVIGPSGCGKTTLLRCMNGLLAEEKGVSVSGRILLDGQEIKSMQKDVLRRRVGLVFQTPAPFPFSIYKNMTYAPRYYGIRDKASLEALVKENSGWPDCMTRSGKIWAGMLLNFQEDSSRGSVSPVP